MPSKYRKIAVAIIAAALSLITLWIAAGFCSTVATPLINTNDISDVTFDGADFTLFFERIRGYRKRYDHQRVCRAYADFGVRDNPDGVGIFRYNAFKKNPAADPEELSFVWRVFVISNALTLAVSLVVMTVYSVKSGNGGFFNALWFCWQEPLFMWVIYIRKLKKNGI